MLAWRKFKLLFISKWQPPAVNAIILRSFTSIKCGGILEDISELRKDTCMWQHWMTGCIKTLSCTDSRRTSSTLSKWPFFSLTKVAVQFGIYLNHRYSLGTSWYRTSRKCSHPLHPPKPEIKTWLRNYAQCRKKCGYMTGQLYQLVLVSELLL